MKQKYCNDNHDAMVIWRKGDDCPLCLANLNVVEEADVKEDVFEDNVLDLFKITDKHHRDLVFIKQTLNDILSAQGLKTQQTQAVGVTWAEY